MQRFGLYIVNILFQHRVGRSLGVVVFLCLVLGLGTLWGPFRPGPRQPKTPAAPYTGPREALFDTDENGFLPLSEATDFCRRRRWAPYGTRDSPRKVYDMFLINTELDVLEIRLHELDEVVDYFIILESAMTFQMDPKPLHLQPRLSDFKAFEHKIIHRVLDDSAARKLPKDDTWAHEHFTRNALFDQVLLSLEGAQAPSQGDVLLVGDIDEIPRRSTLTALRNCAFPPRLTLRSQMYYYSYQWLHRGDLWDHPQATFFNGPKDTVRPEDLRKGESDSELYMAGWHCSSCFSTMADLKNKITSFSHKSFNQAYFLDPHRLLSVVRRGEDLFNREGEEYDRIDNNPDIPTYLQLEGNREKFAYMLDRDPQNANFQDM